jgi:hypothetical protein
VGSFLQLVESHKPISTDPFKAKVGIIQEGQTWVSFGLRLRLPALRHWGAPGVYCTGSRCRSALYGLQSAFTLG